MSTLNTNSISTGQTPSTLGQMGIMQTWQNVAASRVTNTTYTNTTGRPIWIAIEESGAQANSTLTIAGIVVAGHSGVNYDCVICSIVPTGATYVYSGAFATWWELR